jgi:hypothetical protein
MPFAAWNAFGEFFAETLSMVVEKQEGIDQLKHFIDHEKAFFQAVLLRILG